MSEWYLNWKDPTTDITIRLFGTGWSVHGKFLMSDEPSQTGDGIRASGYDVRRLDDVRERVAALEKALESCATKEDVANAKVWLITTWVGILIAVAVGAASILIRVFM